MTVRRTLALAVSLGCSALLALTPIGASPSAQAAWATGGEARPYSTASPEALTGTVAAGGGHTCGLRADGVATCWGSNALGQANVPAGNYTALTAGDVHSWVFAPTAPPPAGATTTTDKPRCPPAPSPRSLPESFHTCGIRTDGTARCWGRNDYGQATRLLPHRRPSPASRPASFTPAGCGPTAPGPAGAATTGASPTSPPAPSPPWPLITSTPAGSVPTAPSPAGDTHVGATDAPAGTFTALTAGAAHTCGLRSTGTVACWGSHFLGAADSPAGT